MACRRQRVSSLSLLVLGACALLAAGCGGGGSPGVASVTGSSTALTAATPNGLLAYSRCMRSHGVAGFPDPDSTGGIPKDQVIAVAGTPNFNTASQACRHLMPATGLAPPQTATQTSSRVADQLSFASCMRRHGVSHFPDPTRSGELSVAMVTAQGIDLHAPAVLRIVRRCLPASHGWLTPTKVSEALGNAGG